MTMSDSSFFTRATSSPYLPIVAGLVRGILGIASSFGFTWALAVTGDQITMIATAAMAVAMLGWSVWQKICAIRDKRRAEVAAAVASIEKGVPVTVKVTPGDQPNEVVRIPAAEMRAAPVVPPGPPSPAPHPAT